MDFVYPYEESESGSDHTDDSVDFQWRWWMDEDVQQPMWEEYTTDMIREVQRG